MDALEIIWKNCGFEAACNDPLPSVEEALPNEVSYYKNGIRFRPGYDRNRCGLVIGTDQILEINGRHLKTFANIFQSLKILHFPFLKFSIVSLLLPS